MNISGLLSPSLSASNLLETIASKRAAEAEKSRKAFEMGTAANAVPIPANSAGLQSPGAATASTLFQAQDIAQNDTDDESIGFKSLTEKFKDFMDKTPDEMLREQILKELGYSEEDLANMSPEELLKAEEEIKQAIQTKIEQALREKGIDADISQASLPPESASLTT